MKNTKNTHPGTRRGTAPVSYRRWWAGPVACLATLLALPATAAIDIPDDPLTTGARVPPNVLFVLDDSGSMAFDAMPASSISGWGGRAYTQNSVYYNPAKTYLPWIGADGTPLTGGTDYNAAYGSYNLVGGTTIDLGDSNSCGRFNRNQSATRDEWAITSGSGTEVCGGTQTFYVPKDLTNTNSGYLGDRQNYWRYQIHTDGVIIRSDYGPRVGAAFPYNRGLDNRGCSTGTGSDFRNCTETLPTSRDADAEKANYATWFSYHRTRMKAAKAGASSAFSELGTNIRVGFRTIWQRGGATSDNTPSHAVPIPVEYNDGLFDDVTVDGDTHDNRSKWYSRLHDAIGNDSTPLHGALYQAGRYFSSDAKTGPYGPEEGDDQLACRQNFTILTTDGYWNNWSNYPSGSRVGDVDGVDGPTITEASTGDSYTYEAVAPYADSHGGSNGTLADVAMHFWKNDLRPTMRNVVPTTTGANPAFWQHMVTFGLSIGLSGSTGFRSVGEVPDTFAAWPDPMDSEDADRIDDLLHAAVNSRGAFVAATDPDEFTSGLKTALSTIVERTGSFSNVAANSTSLDAGARVFQANFVSSVWTGELRSQPVSVADGAEMVNCSGATQPGNGWCASKGIPTTGRNIFTSNGHYYRTPVVPTTSNQTPRTFPTQATAEQLASLERLGPVFNAPVTGTQNAAYLAGSRTMELSQPGGTLRNRNHLLGDIIGSSPAFVGDTNTIYIGANDGMLHAIDAANGNEVFGYIPGIIDWGNLGTLSRPEYEHRYFVDGPIVVSSRQQTPGKNILVGALGKGGKGLFALDVTSPMTFGTGNNVKWEVADTTNNNMGLVQGRPILTRVNNGATPVNAVVLGNGVNSTSGRAALIVLDLDTGAVIREIPVGPTGGSNGLSAPAGVLGPDGRTLAYVYAGDMLGNVWKFDLTNASPASWTATRLFTATDPDGNAQPISGGLTLAVHPVTSQRWVFFGTGRYLTNGDVGSEAVQSMYGFVDDGTALARGGDDANLTPRSVETTGVIVTATGHTYPVRGFQANTPLPTGSKGWYIDLPVSGERIVQDAQVVSTFLITASIVPSGDACESGGTGFINALDAFTGTSAGGSYFDLDGDGSTSDEVVGGRPVGSVNVGGGMPTLPNLLRGRFVVGGSAGADVGGTQTLAPRWDRASWREIRAD